MKRVYYLSLIVAIAAVVTSCNKVNFKKTKSGLIYKIVSSGSKDSTAKAGNWLKLHYKQTLNGDSLLGTSYGKSPIYQQVVGDLSTVKYNPVEIFPMLRKGDSVMVIMFVDSIFSKNSGRQMPPFFKKGDKLELSFKVLEVFRDEAKFQEDQQAEAQKDMPRQMEEQKAQMDKMNEEVKLRAEQETQEAEASGEAAKQRKEIEQYLLLKKITAEKTPRGTYVHIEQQGTGPAADSGKYLTVKYRGRVLATDSTFDSGTYPFRLNQDAVIAGWHDGLKLFRQGGKGTLYIPGYRAYGRAGREGTIITPDAALKFEVEVLNIGDSIPTITPPGR